MQLTSHDKYYEPDYKNIAQSYIKPSEIKDQTRDLRRTISKKNNYQTNFPCHLQNLDRSSAHKPLRSPTIMPSRSFILFIIASIYILNKSGNSTQPCLTPRQNPRRPEFWGAWYGDTCKITAYCLQHSSL